jgi:hypothetical protein
MVYGIVFMMSQAFRFSDDTVNDHVVAKSHPYCAWRLISIANFLDCFPSGCNVSLHTIAWGVLRAVKAVNPHGRRVKLECRKKKSQPPVSFMAYTAKPVFGFNTLF